MSRSSPPLRRALFGGWTHSWAALPYNLNWAIDPGPEEIDHLRRNPLVVCDVGARGGAPEELRSLFPYMVYYAFDADEAESARLNAQTHPHAEQRVFPRFIGGETGVTRFHIYAEGGRSSVYLPSERYMEAFGEAAEFRLEQTVELPCITLDEVVAAEALKPPDMLKLDTQGSELDILRRSTATLRSAHLVEVEVEFTEMYEGQPQFHDVAGFFAERGYELLYLNRQFSQRKEIYGGPARGQITFADALFGRRADQLDGASDASLIAYALLLVNYGHRDLACQVIDRHPQIARDLPAIERYFTQRDHGSAAGRAIVSQVDKLAMLWLHLRRDNRFNDDSDRSWPFR